MVNMEPEDKPVEEAEIKIKEAPEIKAPTPDIPEKTEEQEEPESEESQEEAPQELQKLPSGDFRVEENQIRPFIKSLFDTIDHAVANKIGKAGIWKLSESELDNLSHFSAPVVNKYAGEWLKKYPKEVMLCASVCLVVAPRLMQMQGVKKEGSEVNDIQKQQESQKLHEVDNHDPSGEVPPGNEESY